MKIYDESGQLLESADEAAGWMEPQQRLVKKHPARPGIPAETRTELLPGTADLYHIVIVRAAQPAVPAWDEYETIMVYHPHKGNGAHTLEQRTADLERRTAALERAALGGAQNG